MVIQGPTSAKLPGRNYSYSCVEGWQPKYQPSPQMLECLVNEATKTVEWNQHCIPGLNSNCI